MMQQQIEQKLAALSPTFIEVINESHMHHVPPGSQTHFKAIVVSAEFEGKRPVARHQMVYGLLAEELAKQVHALALHTYTPLEWESAQDDVPDSPVCKG
ncbi:transcriptional regulator [Leminorella grimontii]|uniref:DNA-binding transcriptional regulator BolA n=1 Tax=Leminorella grimontii TaxID=82981 RepID=A0AAV5MZT7_9GAMM|nr:BolA/IbaG family iron-sulfur metabolism protein [Leminorella grimontii]KFC95400.1 BolA family cell division protein [Leminorella grimontii ATCC 33999 = DSM 5078]GKX54031.1 transcriptional regulator [Leminorella grimontii]VFS60236.1 transcriptional regulator BolA [Leminorella grimontii]